MRNYVICSDSACDLKKEFLSELGVATTPLTFRFNGEDKEYSNDDMDVKTFYDRMRAGEVAKTAAVNVDGFVKMFEEIIKEGNDVLYIGFSSGLSTTYNSARLASIQLSEKYPDSKIIAVDTLAASAGFGLILYLACQKKAEGANIEEVAEFVMNNRLSVCHFFTVDDLVYLKRGGRISPTAAFVGNLLGIKPVLHVDNAGHLINISKVRGRRAALTAIADKYGELALDKENGLVYISHGDCLADAELLAGMLKERYGASVKVITDVGTVIGAHSGPGTMALFFIGKER